MTPSISKVHILGYRRFREFIFEPQQGTNVIVGGNEAGKSTLLEAMALALTGRVNGIRAEEYLNPYWFNRDMVYTFFDKQPHERNHKDAPEFRIDLYLDVESRELEKLRGVNNITHTDSAGLSIWAHPNPEYAQELDDYFQQDDCPKVLPVEYYQVEWLSFAGFPVFRRPKEIGISMIDSRTIRSERGVDYYTRQIVESRLDPKDRSQISVAHRKLRATLGTDVLQDLNATLVEENQSIPGAVVGIQIDQSRSTSWEATLIPEIDHVPLSMAGQGNQAVAKTVLAMGRSADSSSLVFVEEPENHLSHTRMRQLISYIERSAHDRQVFITTHSSYVLNRLGFNKVTLLSNGTPARFDGLEKDTILYFRRLSGFDTLRIILADMIVIVEGPSDEIVFNRFFKDRFGREPLDCGVDVMSVNGVSFKRCFELAALLRRPLFAIRDNDRQSREHWQRKIGGYLHEGERMLFVGDQELGNTLEPQIQGVNDEQSMRTIFPEVDEDNFSDWMQKNKTNAALKIAESEHTLIPPTYIQELLDVLGARIGSA
ncbi:ATP-dependent nuclease [Corynebacterium lizhenjunii]|uniref:ATP-dependent nuclease n=1 Tax=Corynebacterium lizhenjunii TaxID=2709394 RepID=UPI0013ED2802|nr:AAA family ATPase [Corynebacterium lizhenjunii]